ncbi:MAG: hypothetical protein HYR58_05450 [Acidobacteria bacterium]|nr:hypothetical protein [Acidobacteriota bacterium]
MVSVKLTRSLFFLGLGIGLVASALAFMGYYLNISFPRVEAFFFILFPGALANGDLERGPFSAELFKAVIFSLINGCIFGCVGMLVVKTRYMLISGKPR